jgi:hypothetical protein
MVINYSKKSKTKNLLETGTTLALLIGSISVFTIPVAKFIVPDWGL